MPGGWVDALDAIWSASMSRVHVSDNSLGSAPCGRGQCCGRTSFISLLAKSLNSIFFSSPIARVQGFFGSGSVTGTGDSRSFPHWSGRALPSGMITEYGPLRQAAVAFLSPSDRIFRVLCKTRAASRSFLRADARGFQLPPTFARQKQSCAAPTAASEG
jgi:hypothetical protein